MPGRGAGRARTVPTGVQAPTITTVSLATSVNPVPAAQPVTFTAAVAASTGTAIPSGLVAFTDGSTLLGVVTLDQTGRQAALTISTLANGLHPIRAYYIGTPAFESSHSPAVFELVGYTWPAFRTMEASHRTS